MIKIGKNNPFIVFLVVFGLLIFLHGFGVLRPLENFLLFSVKSVSGNLYKQGSEFNDSYEKRRGSDLAEQVDILTKEVEKLTIANSNWQEIEEENIKLRSQLDFFSENNLKAVVGQVIAKESLADVGDQEGDIIINKGKNNGLSLGLAVVSEGGAVVGKIVELKSTSAKVCLITSRGCHLAAAIQNQNKTIGLTEGELGLTVKMNYIPQSETIAIGDIIITSGLGVDIPRGLVLGKITMINSESNEVWQSASIEPLVNFNNLTLVSVILP